MRPLFLLIALLTLPACSSAPRPPKDATTAAKSVAAGFSTAIDAADFRSHLRKLSSDELEGRGPGTRGERLTTDYIREQFIRIGLQPGNRGSWLQSVPTVATTLVNTDLNLQIAQGGGVEKYAYRDELIVNSLSGKERVELKDSPVVYLGYGVNAPEHGWNDYAGIDVKGKTVIVLVNDPGFGNNDASLFKGRAMTYYGRWTYKFEEAARQGAAACFIVHQEDAAGYAWGVVQNSWSGPQFDLPADEDRAPRLDAAGWLSGAAARRLFTRSGLDFDAQRKAADMRGFKPLALAASASIELRSTVARSSSDNVVGLLEGSSDATAAIVYSAHWDHLGRDDSLSGDKIYNGAIDNATGVAGLLEIAEAFAHQDPRPRRSLLFVALTLEESGLLGSKYYVAHAPFPLRHTVADINMDALYLLGRAHNMAIVGFGQSDLDALLAQALDAQGRRVSAEEAPEKGHFFRSDHFNFARGGVPALYAKSGLDLVAGGSAAGKIAVDNYTNQRYHKPADEYRDELPVDGTVEDLQALYQVGRQLADAPSWPQWAADSEFRQAREAARGK